MGLICIPGSSLDPSLSPCKREKGWDEARPGTDKRRKSCLDTWFFRAAELSVLAFLLWDQVSAGMGVESSRFPKGRAD